MCIQFYVNHVYQLEEQCYDLEPGTIIAIDAKGNYYRFIGASGALTDPELWSGAFTIKPGHKKLQCYRDFWRHIAPSPSKNSPYMLKLIAAKKVSLSESRPVPA